MAQRQTLSTHIPAHPRLLNTILVFFITVFSPCLDSPGTHHTSRGQGVGSASGECSGTVDPVIIWHEHVTLSILYFCLCSVPGWVRFLFTDGQITLAHLTPSATPPTAPPSYSRMERLLLPILCLLSHPNCSSLLFTDEQITLALSTPRPPTTPLNEPYPVPCKKSKKLCCSYYTKSAALW